VVYGDAKGDLEAFAKSFRAVRLLETVAERSRADYAWPVPFLLETQSCGRPGANFDPDTRKLTMCYEQAFDFAELYRAYVSLSAPPPPVSPAPTGRKRKSK
jgi:hypothetical protein